MNKLSDEDYNFNTDMFRIISKRTINKLLEFKEINPNIIYLISHINYPSKVVAVNFDKRLYGKSSYSILEKLEWLLTLFYLLVRNQ